MVVDHGSQLRRLRRVSGHEQTMAARSDCWDRDSTVSKEKGRKIAPPLWKEPCMRLAEALPSALKIPSRYENWYTIVRTIVVRDLTCCLI